MQRTLLDQLTTRIAALPDWCADVLEDGVLPLLESLAFDPEMLVHSEQDRHWTALAALNGREERLERRYATAE
jgi:hypothetical protein